MGRASCQQVRAPHRTHLQSVARFTLEGHHIVDHVAVPSLDGIARQDRLLTGSKTHSCRKEGQTLRGKREREREGGGREGERACTLPHREVWLVSETMPSQVKMWKEHTLRHSHLHVHTFTHTHKHTLTITLHKSKGTASDFIPLSNVTITDSGAHKRKFLFCQFEGLVLAGDGQYPLPRLPLKVSNMQL